MEKKNGKIIELDIGLFIRKKAKGFYWLINVVLKGYNSRNIPLGTVLGLLFFLVDINDIVEKLLSIVRLFTDDTSLACSSSNIHDTEGILNHDLLVLSTWRKQWLIDFYPSKSEAIIFSCNDAYHSPNHVRRCSA